jgi:hypothetical protein
METLTKDNFWNSVMENYPDSVGAFCKWIDEYKASIYWDDWADIKFHHLPGPMQFGILLHYFKQIGGCYFELDVFNDDWREVIESAFAIEEQKFQDGVTNDPF